MIIIIILLLKRQDILQFIHTPSFSPSTVELW